MQKYWKHLQKIWYHKIEKKILHVLQLFYYIYIHLKFHPKNQDTAHVHLSIFRGKLFPTKFIIYLFCIIWMVLECGIVHFYSINYHAYHSIKFTTRAHQFECSQMCIHMITYLLLLVKCHFSHHNLPLWS